MFNNFKHNYLYRCNDLIKPKWLKRNKIQNKKGCPMASSIEERQKIRDIYKVVEKTRLTTCSITFNTTIFIDSDMIKRLGEANLDLEDLIGEILYRCKLDGLQPRIVNFICASEELMIKLNGKHELWNLIQSYVEKSVENHHVSEISTFSKQHLIILLEKKLSEENIGK